MPRVLLAFPLLPGKRCAVAADGHTPLLRPSKATFGSMISGLLAAGLLSAHGILRFSCLANCLCQGASRGHDSSVCITTLPIPVGGGQLISISPLFCFIRDCFTTYVSAAPRLLDRGSSYSELHICLILLEQAFCKALGDSWRRPSRIYVGCTSKKVVLVSVSVPQSNGRFPSSLASRSPLSS